MFAMLYLESWKIGVARNLVHVTVNCVLLYISCTIGFVSWEGSHARMAVVGMNDQNVNNKFVFFATKNVAS